jgi:hypothetical protein
MDPPYVVPHPKELTRRLHTNWLNRRAQNRQRSHRSEPAHIEQNVPSTRNTQILHFLFLKFALFRL